jgi:hypothetical protein
MEGAADATADMLADVSYFGKLLDQSYHLAKT